MTTRRRSIAATAAALIMIASAQTASAAPTTKNNDAALDRAFATYVQNNPGDWVGAAELVESLGGSMVISGDDGELTTPQEATAEFNRLNGSSSGLVTPMAWPAKAFTASVAVVTTGPTDSTVSIAGAWNWKDDFVGQGSPVDIAAILISKSCGTWGSYAASTKKWNGTATSGRTSLRSGGVGSAGPIWNIIDGVSNFENYVDNGVVSAVYNRSACSASEKKTIQGEFVYEGNAGGSLISVSAGWGGFGVSYSNHDHSQTRSSGAKTVPY